MKSFSPVFARSLAGAAVLGIFLIMVLPLAAAQVELTVEPAKVTTYTNTETRFTVSIRNNLDHPASFLITFPVAIGNPPWWPLISKILTNVGSNQTETYVQGFFPTNAEPRTYQFTIKATNYDDPSIQASRSLMIEILPPVSFTSLSATRVGDEVRASVGVFSNIERTLTISTELLDPEGRVLRSQSSSEKVSGNRTIEMRFPLVKPAPGQYKVRARVENLESKTAAVAVAEIRDLKRTVEKMSTAWYEDTIYTYDNSGSNVAVDVKEEPTYWSGDLITAMVTAPQSCATVGGEQKCTYELSVPAGETKQVVVRKALWPTYIEIAVGIIIVLVIAVLAMGRYSKPRLYKSYRKRKDHVSVFLNVRNSFGQAKNVIIRDWVSPLATVLTEEFEGAKPIVRKSDAGTELLWSLPEIRPGEERLISYKIKPSAQTIKLGSASLRYKNKKDQLVRRLSNQVVIS